MIKLFLYSFLAILCVTHSIRADDRLIMSEGLILSPGIEEGQAFYKDSVFEIGDQTVRIEHGVLPNNQKVKYTPEWNLITINQDPNISEDEKGQALVELLDALIIEQTIMPASGQEDN